MGAGAMRERLLIQTTTPITRAVSSLTSVGTTATVATLLPHGYATGDYVTIAGATPAGYNGKVKVTVTTTTQFTFTVGAGLASPATGVITAVYESDALGGPNPPYRTLDTVAAELIPIRASERLAAAAIQSEVAYRFRTRVRADVTQAMRALWTPSWPPNAPQQTLEITGILPDRDGRQSMFLECTKASA